ncbi:MAG: hypothetical protein ACE5JH_01325 [Acidobacteriota bacterium]
MLRNRCRRAGAAGGRERFGAAGALGCLILAAAALGPATLLGAERSRSRAEHAPPDEDREALERRLGELERVVAALRAEIARLRAAGSQADAPPASEHAIRGLERKVEALTLEILRLKAERTPIPRTGRSINGFGPAASKIFRAKRGVVIGGYGEMLYQNFTTRKDDDTPSNAKSRADLVRAVTYVGYRADSRFLFSTAIEIENAGGDGSPGSGDVSLEFAFIDFRATPRFAARAGLVLIPLGFLNEQHESPAFHGARRPETEQRIIPTTWRENGAGVYGGSGPVTYRAYVVNSLDAGGFSPDEGIRGGRQQGGQAKASNLAVTGRLDYAPRPGVLVGLSAFTGKSGQGTPGFPGGRLTMWDLHGEWVWRGLRLRGLLVRSILSDAREISLAIDPSGSTAIGSRMKGWYLEASWDVLERVEHTRQRLVPFCRFEDLDTQARVPRGLSPDPANDLTVRTCGLTYRPIPDLAIKLDAQNFDQQAHTAVDQVNLGFGYSF